MRVDLTFTPHQIDEMQLRDKIVVVIDVLRASTSIATALQNGAKEVIPVATIEAAVKISGNLFGDVTLLGGERNGKMIEGFNLGNSPTEYTEEKVRGKSIIFSSTNGALAMTRARFARSMVVCGFINISRVVEYVNELNQDFVIICSGKDGSFALEDAVCAGMLIKQLTGSGSEVPELADSAIAAFALYKSFGRAPLKLVKNCEHGKYLQAIGFGRDLKLCASVDTVPVLPLLIGNVIKLRREVEIVEAPQVASENE